MIIPFWAEFFNPEGKKYCKKSGQSVRFFDFEALYLQGLFAAGCNCPVFTNSQVCIELLNG